MTFRRYAIYAAPEGALWDAGSQWLGWDALHGAVPPAPEIAGLPCPLAEITETPRKYGLHATIKAPFRLAEGTTPEDLAWAAAALCLRLSPVVLAGLRLEHFRGFLALVPEGDATELAGMAARVVEALDPFRAPQTPEETARRHPQHLTPRQRAHLDRWGYPHVMEDFRFHVTLSGRLDLPAARAVVRVLDPWLRPHMPRPYAVDSLCLFGEAEDGRFRLMRRFPFGS
jgi:putative phosphonate metabolism protein